MYIKCYTFLYALYTVAYVPLPSFSVKTKSFSLGTTDSELDLQADDGRADDGRAISALHFLTFLSGESKLLPCLHSVKKIVACVLGLIEILRKFS
jgi:hypothetical protein